MPGVVPKDYHDDKGSMTPFKTYEHFYMPKVDQDLHDTQGRRWLGNPWEKEGLQGALCWGNETTWVRIVDSCPPNPLSPWCRADSTVFHFDMSYWAFERLAHPLYGVMPIRFRPVDCDSKRPLVVDSSKRGPTASPDAATAKLAELRNRHGNKLTAVFTSNSPDADSIQLAYAEPDTLLGRTATHLANA